MSSFEDVERYASFYDPFAEGNIVGKSDVFPEALPVVHVDAPPPYNSAVKSEVLNVVSAKLVSPNDSKADDFPLTYNGRTNLTLEGQGTIIANSTAAFVLLFCFSTKDSSKSSLYARITEDNVELWRGSTPPEGSTGYLPPDRVEIKGYIIGDAPKLNKKTYLRPHIKYPARYWLSVDRKNGILRFGRDYANLAQSLYEAKLNLTSKGELTPEFAFVDQLTTVHVQQRGGDPKAPPLQLIYQPFPVVERKPPIILPSELITLDLLAKGAATVPANLSTECQRLYANVAGVNIKLDTDDFPHFTEAIERSVNTEGLLCQRLLKKKASEFGKEDYKSTYLRITLGADLGNSPGAPYVLEIWPDTHASPIHNHGNSHAVIKVLHGKIKAYYFTSLVDPVPLGAPINLKKDDVTWIDKENYQVHQLSNESRDGSVCCTIQCYSYGAEDTRHYEAFDYINEDTREVIEQFHPDSDMRFDEFKAAVLQEWNDKDKH